MKVVKILSKQNKLATTPEYCFSIQRKGETIAVWKPQGDFGEYIQAITTEKQEFIEMETFWFSAYTDEEILNFMSRILKEHQDFETWILDNFEDLADDYRQNFLF